MKETANLLAEVDVNISASKTKIWKALTNPELISQYMFGAKAESDWREGSRITWRGSFQGRAYRDSGVIIQMLPESLLQYTHYSPLSKLPDTPENYHIVTIELIELNEEEKGTLVTLTQNNISSEEAKKHSEKNWKQMLEGLKKVAESL